MPTTKTKPVSLQVPWNAPANIHTLITTSKGNFNPALHVEDDQAKVLAARRQLAQQLPTPPLWLNQTHSTKVMNWDRDAYLADIEADAAITTQKNKVCVVMTADCLPILLTNKSGDFVAAIHAGWRGLHTGIIAKTLDKLQRFARQEMLAFIGPAIGQECFEVGAEVRESFVTKAQENELFFSGSKNTGKFMANLRAIAGLELEKFGLNPANITNPNICTKCNTEWFYSYRANPQTGRMATLIWKD